MHSTAPQAITFDEAYKAYDLALFRLTMAAKREISAKLAHLNLSECELVLIDGKLHLDNAKSKSAVFGGGVYKLDAAGYREAQALIQPVLDRLNHIVIGQNLPVLWLSF
jgi:hypothetical protein